MRDTVIIAVKNRRVEEAKQLEDLKVWAGTSLVVQWLRIQCRGHRFHPWSRKILHATEQLSLCATTAELKLVCLEPMLCSKRSRGSESLCTATETSPHSPHLEEARVQQRRVFNIYFKH